MFSKNIRYLRKKRGLSQQALADKLGYRSNVAVHKWESGENTPAVDSVKMLAHLFGVSIEDLMSVDLERRDAEALTKDGAEVTASRAVPIIDNVTVDGGIISSISARGIMFVDDATRADSCVIMPDNSMDKSGIHKGDKVLLKRDFEPISGKLYAVFTDSVLVRRVSWVSGLVILTSDALPEVEKDAVIIGEAVGVYHEI